MTASSDRAFGMLSGVICARHVWTWFSRGPGSAAERYLGTRDEFFGLVDTAYRKSTCVRNSCRTSRNWSLQATSAFAEVGQGPASAVVGLGASASRAEPGARPCAWAVRLYPLLVILLTTHSV